MNPWPMAHPIASLLSGELSIALSRSWGKVPALRKLPLASGLGQKATPESLDHGASDPN